MFTKEQISILKKSPIYNFSLSSKELFHSNFLYWLLNDIVTNANREKESKLFWQLLCDKLRLPKDLLEFQIGLQNEILRERNNTDLRFTILKSPEVSRRVILENKVKSIPYFSQLKEYSEKSIDGDILILLTLHDPIRMKNSKGEIEMPNGMIWHVLTYRDLQLILESFIKNEIISNSYRNNIIQDYLLLIDALIKIDQKASISLEENFDWHQNEFYKQLKDLRVADFYIKKKCTTLVDVLKDHIVNDDLLKDILSENITWNLPNPQIQVSAGFTNGSGLIDVKFKFTQNMSAGIQIQGNQFRLVIEEDFKKKSKEFAHKLISEVQWFDFSTIEYSGKIYPRNDGLNSYSGVFYYRYVNIPTNTTINKLIKYILDYLKSYTLKSDLLIKLLNEK
jgi:hypothetical protein